ncbi:MAG: hypothetical protein V1891_01860 [bacterium]
MFTKFNFSKNNSILALGSEFDTRLAFYCDGEIIFSENIGNLADDEARYEKFVCDFLGCCGRRANESSAASMPCVIITDLHPLYTSRKVGEKLAKKWKAKHLTAQHHIAHIFSAFGDYQMFNDRYEMLNNIFYGIACDGTGYGLDGNIWGGEVFKCHFERSMAELSGYFARGQYLIKRIGHLENHYLIGGELAVEEPARMLISILSEFLSKQEVFKYVKRYYSENEFNVLSNQLEKKFNCLLSSSAGRVLDAVSILLGFCENKRKYKHYPIKMMEDRSAVLDNALPYISCEITKNTNGEYVLNIINLFKYLIDNLKKIDKHKLGFAAQRYIIEGLYGIVKRYDMGVGKRILDDCSQCKIVLSGGLATNKTIKEFSKDNNIYISKKIPSGDEGIALGQIIYGHHTMKSRLETKKN